MDKIGNAGDELGNARGNCRAEYAHIEVKNGDVVEHAVGQAPTDDREERIARIAVRFDEHLEVIGYKVTHAERRDAEKVLLDIVERDLIRAEKVGERL